MPKKPKPKLKAKNPRYVWLGKRISELRMEQGLSLRVMAKEIGVQPAYVSKIENGEVPPSEKFIQDAAKILNEDPNALFFYTGKLTEELFQTITKQPKAFADLIKQLKNAPENAILRVIREVRTGEW